MRTIAATAALALSLVLAAAGCGGKGKGAPPPPPDPAAACHLDGPDGTPANAEQCECAGLMVVGDIGDGQVRCPDGSVEVSRIQYGIEGGVCCRPADVTAAP